MTDDATNGDRPANHDDVVGRTFAAMLGELEDVATALTQRQSELARELSDVEAELHRVEAVRAAMASGGTAKAKRTGPPSAGYKPAPEVVEKMERTLTWARERGEEFTGNDAAEFLGVNPQGVGPMLAGMARRGHLAVRKVGSSRLYSVADNGAA